MSYSNASAYNRLKCKSLFIAVSLFFFHLFVILSRAATSGLLSHVTANRLALAVRNAASVSWLGFFFHLRCSQRIFADRLDPKANSLVGLPNSSARYCMYRRASASRPLTRSSKRLPALRKRCKWINLFKSTTYLLVFFGRQKLLNLRSLGPRHLQHNGR